MKRIHSEPHDHGAKGDERNRTAELSLGADSVYEHSCPLPTPRKRDLNRLYICECGKAWTAVRWRNYAGDGIEWRRWEP